MSDQIQCDNFRGVVSLNLVDAGQRVALGPDLVRQDNVICQAEPEVDWAGEPLARLMGMATEVRLACRRCMAAKGIFTAVSVLAWTDENLCLRHQL